MTTMLPISQQPAGDGRASAGGRNRAGEGPRNPHSGLRTLRFPGKSLGNALFVLLVGFVAFVGGAMIVLGKQFPYEPLRNAYLAGEALIRQHRQVVDRFETDLWREPRSDLRGVFLHDPTRAFQGYTLYTSGDSAAARLIGMDGRLLHEWQRPYSSVWNEAAAVKSPQPDELIYMRKARLLANGDLLAIYEAAADTPWGYGMVKLDRHSNLVWSYLGHTHHDFDVAPNGRIYALTHEFTTAKLPQFEALEPPRLDDFIVVLTPEGDEIEKVSLTGALLRSRFAAYAYAMPNFSLADPLHTNTVRYLDAGAAKSLPAAEEGDVLVSFRDMGLIAVVDLDLAEVVWATRGSWMGQHDPRLTPNGNVLLFDNFGAFRAENSSRVVEFDPRTMAVVWTYSGDEAEPLHSPIRSAAQPLPNGNVLITESDGGRLFEVTRGGEVVWSFVNPLRGGDGQSYLPVVSGGQRIHPESLTHDFRSWLER